MNTYPVLNFLARMGWPLAFIAGLATMVSVAGLWAWQPYAWAGGAVAGVAMALVMKSYLELVRLITDMLLPK